MRSSTDIIGYSFSKGRNGGLFERIMSSADLDVDSDGSWYVEYEQSSNDSHLSDKEKLFILEEELHKLRESTKEALHQSWDETSRYAEEVEIMKIKLTNQKEKITLLEESCQIAESNETKMMERCFQAETKLAQQEEEITLLQKTQIKNKKIGKLPLQAESRQGSGTITTTSLGSSLNSFGSMKSFLNWTTRQTKSPIDTPSGSKPNTAPCNDIIPCNNAFLAEKDENIRKLETKIATRDTVIEALEETLETNALYMRSLNIKNCTEDNIEDKDEQEEVEKGKQQAKKQTRDEMNDNTPVFKETINNLRYEVDERNTTIKLQELKIIKYEKIIMKKRERLSKSKGYIKELSKELRNALNVIKSRERENSYQVEID